MAAKRTPKRTPKKDRELEKLVAKMQTPEFITKAEAPMHKRLQKAACKNEEILRRSREVSNQRVLRSQC